jgi:hypothetical protein
LFAVLVKHGAGYFAAFLGEYRGLYGDGDVRT